MEQITSVRSSYNCVIANVLHIFHVRVLCTVGLVGLPRWLVWRFEALDDNFVGSLSSVEAMLYENC